MTAPRGAGDVPLAPDPREFIANECGASHWGCPAFVKEVCWIDIHENDVDERWLARWVKQAAGLPGWLP